MTLKELGLHIQEKREAAGISIDDVAARIKISARLLRTIEAGSLEGLPHAVYTKSFIRTFALLVGYDKTELNKNLDVIFPPESLDETRNEPGPRTRTIHASPGYGKKIALLVVFALVLAGLAFGGWYLATNYGEEIMNIVKSPFSAITSPAPATEQQPGPSSSTPGAVRTSAQTQHTDPGVLQTRSATNGEHARLPTPPGETSQQAASAPVSPASAGVNASAASSGTASPTSEENSLHVLADETCWISVYADGAKVYSFILQPGENTTFTYRNTMEITFGNAGGVTLTHNGKALGKPGKPGQRVVERFPATNE